MRKIYKDWVKCAICGQFISNKDFERGLVKSHFTPDTHFGPEESEFEHVKCRQKELKPNRREN
jgi:hypothetical protein